jgi:hypothetical protein
MPKWLRPNAPRWGDDVPWSAVQGGCQRDRAGAGAVLGGTQLLRNGFGMPLSWLSHTPFTGWALPGLGLLIGVAMPQLAVLALIMASNRWALAASHLAGLALVAWILVQLLVLQRYFFLQPVIAGIGALEVLLAWAWHHKTLNAD